MYKARWTSRTIIRLLGAIYLPTMKVLREEMRLSATLRRNKEKLSLDILYSISSYDFDDFYLGESDGWML